MSLTFAPVTEADVRELVYWAYKPPYDIYNVLAPTDEPDDGLLAYFIDPVYNYHAIRDEASQLVAFCSFGLDGQVPGGDYSTPALDIGLGMRPDLTGQGRGFAFVAATIDFAIKAFNPTTLRVTIAEFNQRAQHVWQQAGFRQAQTFRRGKDGLPFIIFDREAYKL